MSAARRELQILARQTRSLGDACEHLWADLFLIVERENEIRPVGTLHRPMRAGLPLDRPADAQQGGEHTGRACGRPLSHGSCGHDAENGLHVRKSLTVLQPLGQNSQRECLRSSHRLLPCRTVRQNSRESGHFRDPATILFLLGFDLVHAVW